MKLRLSLDISKTMWISLGFISAVSCGGDDSEEPVTQTPSPPPFEEKISNIIISGNNVVFSVEVDSDRYELLSADHTSGTRTDIADVFSANRPLDSLFIAPDGTRIGYLADRNNDGTDELYTNLLDGSSEVQISSQITTNTAGSQAVAPITWQWMPDSSRIIFRSDLDGDGIIDIQTNLPDGSDPITISNGLSITCELETCWKISSDSSVITFINETATSQQLQSVAPTSQTPTQIDSSADPSAEIVGWNFAPDDSAIAYIRKNASSPRELFTVSADGSQNTAIGIENNSLGVQEFVWSPDSSKIAYSDDSLTDGVLSLYTNIPDGTNNIHMIDTFIVTNPILRNWQWAPDSSRIAYIANQESSDLFELFSVENDGRWHRRLNPILPASSLVHSEWQWSPTSNFVAFFAEIIFPTNYDELFSSTADASQINQINLPSNSSRTIRITDQHWTPDGSKIIYSLVDENNEIELLFAVNPDGTNIKQLNEGLAEGEQIQDDFTISLDSSRILYRVNSADGTNNTLHTTSLNTGSRVNLVTIDNVKQAYWTSDSSKVIYVVKTTSEEAEQLYSILPNGNNKVQLY